MLVLSRLTDESIMIGDEVEITIVNVRSGKVRLGITAPKSIPVHRREIYDTIQREKAQEDAELHPGGNNEPTRQDHRFPARESRQIGESFPEIEKR